jgi:hypothetical protein
VSVFISIVFYLQCLTLLSASSTWDNSVRNELGDIAQAIHHLRFLTTLELYIYQTPPFAEPFLSTARSFVPSLPNLRTLVFGVYIRHIFGVHSVLPMERTERQYYRCGNTSWSLFSDGADIALEDLFSEHSQLQRFILKISHAWNIPESYIRRTLTRMNQTGKLEFMLISEKKDDVVDWISGLV